MTSCPCQSGLAFDLCCGPILAGRPAPTAQALMRSRYTAYGRIDIAHLERSLTPEMKSGFDPAETKRMAEATQWRGLEVIATQDGGPDDATGMVEYAARFRLNGEEQMLHERADFRRGEDGGWLYSGGIVAPPARQRIGQKAGRNDPCPCGSGRKFKKCCGA